MSVLNRTAGSFEKILENPPLSFYDGILIGYNIQYQRASDCDHPEGGAAMGGWASPGTPLPDDADAGRGLPARSRLRGVPGASPGRRSPTTANFEWLVREMDGLRPPAAAAGVRCAGPRRCRSAWATRATWTRRCWLHGVRPRRARRRSAERGVRPGQGGRRAPPRPGPCRADRPGRDPGRYRASRSRRGSSGTLRAGRARAGPRSETANRVHCLVRSPVPRRCLACAADR